MRKVTFERVTDYGSIGRELWSSAWVTHLYLPFHRLLWQIPTHLVATSSYTNLLGFTSRIILKVSLISRGKKVVTSCLRHLCILSDTPPWLFSFCRTRNFIFWGLRPFLLSAYDQSRSPWPLALPITFYLIFVLHFTYSLSTTYLYSLSLYNLYINSKALKILSLCFITWSLLSWSDKVTEIIELGVDLLI